MFSINITERTLEPARTIPPFYSILFIWVFLTIHLQNEMSSRRKRKVTFHFTEQMLFQQRKRNC